MSTLPATHGEPVKVECPGCGDEFETYGRILYCSDCLKKRTKKKLRNLGGKPLQERATNQ